MEDIMEDIIEEIEHAEVSAILDSNGETIEQFEESKKSKTGVQIKLNTILVVIVVAAFMAIMLYAAMKLIPIILCIALLNIIINKIIKIFRK